MSPWRAAEYRGEGLRQGSLRDVNRGDDGRSWAAVEPRGESDVCPRDLPTEFPASTPLDPRVEFAVMTPVATAVPGRVRAGVLAVSRLLSWLPGSGLAVLVGLALIWLGGAVHTALARWTLAS